jgi:diguanylate cyclase (GGDEF)-like protein
MNVCVVTKDAAVIEVLTDLCREEHHELGVRSLWPPGPGDCAHLVFLDVDCLGRMSEVDPSPLASGGLVLVCSADQADQMDASWLSVAEDLVVKPLRSHEVRYKLRLWDRTVRQQEAIRTLERRVDELAAEADRQASILNDVEVRQQLAGRSTSRLEQVLEKLHMVTQLSRLINCLDLQTIVEACVERVPLLVGARFASLYFHDQRSGHLVLERHNHPWKIADRVDLADVVNSPMSLAIQRRRLILIRDFKEFEAREQLSIDRGFMENYTTSSCIVAPLMSGHRIIGVLNLADKMDGQPFDEEIDLPPIEQLCELIGASIYNIELFREVERQAKTDGLTGLANHRTFVERLTEEVGRANRYGSKLSLLMIDMDGLKLVNDRLGHQAGDTTLAQVARVIERSIRASDLAARYGGDEFAVVLVETSLRQAQALADRLLQGVRGQKLVVDGEAVPITLSIGVGQYEGDATPDHFIKRVDTALYEAKRQGKDRVALAASGAAGSW